MTVVTSSDCAGVWATSSFRSHLPAGSRAAAAARSRSTSRVIATCDSTCWTCLSSGIGSGRACSPGHASGRRRVAVFPESDLRSGWRTARGRFTATTARGGRLRRTWLHRRGGRGTSSGMSTRPRLSASWRRRWTASKERTPLWSAFTSAAATWSTRRGPSRQRGSGMPSRYPGRTPRARACGPTTPTGAGSISTSGSTSRWRGRVLP
ncbi:MAG: hypothetical protein QOE36_2102 [Gaiellaceae bacterium]|nr:hypothetical protein [Gaiellaceae bacterium]